MRRNLVRSALIGSLLSAALPVAAFAADDPDGRVRSAQTPIAGAGAPTPGTTPFAAGGATGLRICSSDPATDNGFAQFNVEGLTFGGGVTPKYAVTPVLNSGNPRCWDFAATQGLYRISPGKYMSASCVQTVNGEITNPPTNTTDRCEGKVHHWHTIHDRLNATPANRGPETTLELAEVEVTVVTGEVTLVSAHVTDIRYPECTESADPNRVCEPDPGPTT